MPNLPQFVNPILTRVGTFLNKFSQNAQRTKFSSRYAGEIPRDLEFLRFYEYYHGWPEIITEADVARIAGVNIVKSTAIADGAGAGANAGKRSVLFKPFASFGLVSERDFTLEAQRWNKQQVINVTGTQVVGGFVKNQEYTCRISHTSVDA